MATRSRAKQLLAKLRRASRANKIASAVVALGVAAGGFVLISSLAATFFFSLEAENASRTGQAKVVSDSNASGGSALRFEPPVPAPDPDPDPDPNPGTRSCPPFPAFPNASCTGVLPGVARTNSGGFTTTHNGQVIENMNVSGTINVKHNNVVIRNVKFTSGMWAVYINQNTGLLVEDCEIDGSNMSSGLEVIAEHNYTMRRCNIHHTGEGPRINGNVTLEDNYIHTFRNFSHQDAHQDCIQITSGTNIVIRHNTCLMDVEGGNAAIMTGTSSGSNLLFEKNLFGGGGWSVYCGDNQYTNVRVLSNHFTTTIEAKGGFYGPLGYCSQATKSGNVWHDGPNAGQPI